MRVKKQLSDFEVKELTNVQFVPKGDFLIYEVKKRGIDALKLKNILRSLFVADIGLAGLKDRNAITTQLISVKSKLRFRNYSERNFSVKFIGFSNGPIKMGNLKGNKFKIIVRNISKEELVKFKENIDLIEKNGFVNYFGDQRFGHITNARKFIFEPYFKKDYEGTIKLFLTLYRKKDPKKLKDAKKTILKFWGDWKKCLENVPEDERVLVRILKSLKDNGDFKRAIDLVPRDLKEIYILSYLGYLWNLEASKIIKKKRHVLVGTSIGDLAFPKEIMLNQKVKINMPSEVKYSNFEKRDLIAKVGKLSYFIQKDSVLLEFVLGSGSYATTLLKAIFEK